MENLYKESSVHQKINARTWLGEDYRGVFKTCCKYLMNESNIDSFSTPLQHSVHYLRAESQFYKMQKVIHERAKQSFLN